MGTYLLCSSPCSPEGTVKHSSMWPCNNLRTSPPIRYPWIKRENRVHFYTHSNTQNYSSNYTKHYQVDFSFSCLKFYITLKKESEEGEDVSYPGESVEHCQVGKASSQQLGKDEQDREATSKGSYTVMTTYKKTEPTKTRNQVLLSQITKETVRNSSILPTHFSFYLR